jgi:hypothetical protein
LLLRSAQKRPDNSASSVQDIQSHALNIVEMCRPVEVRDPS